MNRKQHKPIKPKKCKQCGNQFTAWYSTAQSVCSTACAIKLSGVKEKIKFEKENRKAKKIALDSLMTKSEWLNLAQKVFNTFIRLRDAEFPCISCDAITGKWSAGHFHSQGGHSFLRFHEDNLNKQCFRCNFELHSNPHEYRERLTLKIGAGRVEYLDKHRNSPRKYSIDEVKELISEYRLKIKQLKITNRK
jgi:hypothetical protein